MNVVGAGLGLNEDGAAGCAPELWSVGRRDDLELLNRVRAGTHIGVVVEARYFDTIDLVGVGKFALTINEKLRLFPPPPGATPGTRSAAS